MTITYCEPLRNVKPLDAIIRHNKGKLFEHIISLIYIDNVIEMNVRAIVTENKEAVNTVYNVAYGERTTLNELVAMLKEYLSDFDSEIKNVNVEYGPNRKGDVPHSLASIEKAKTLLGYKPSYDIKSGLKEAVSWYWKNLK